MIKTNELPNITSFAETDGFVVDTAAATGRLTGKNMVEFTKNYLQEGCYSSGKALSDSWATLKAKASSGNVAGIHVGDYKTINLTTGETVICEVAGINQYKGHGDAAIGGHIDFISRDCLATAMQFNATDTNNGTAEVKSPWLASKLYDTLNNETTGVYATLPTDLKPNIITKRVILEERYSAGGAVAADTGWSW